MFRNFCFFVQITIIEIKKPDKKQIPTPRERMEFYTAIFDCIDSSINGNFFPKYLYRKTPPMVSIRNKNKGMKIFATKAGIINVVTTKTKHRAATVARLKIIYRLAEDIAKRGLPYSD